MMKVKVAFIALSCMLAHRVSRAQCIPPLCENAHLATGTLGYGSARIADLGTVPDRVMRGVNGRLDVRILPILVRQLPFATHDALFGDFTYGPNTSEKVPTNRPEPTVGTQVTFGYELLVGGQAQGVAVLGGVGWRHYVHRIGSTKMIDTSLPLLARVEVGGRRRVVVTVWSSFRRDAPTGGRVELPITRPLSLSVMYWQADGSATLFITPTTEVRAARARTLTVGLRTVQRSVKRSPE